MITYYDEDGKVTQEKQPTSVLQIYQNHNVEIDQKIKKFWFDNNAFGEATEVFLNERLSQVLHVVLNEENEIIGVSSGNPTYFELIRNNFIYFRLFVLDEYRGKNRHVAINLYYAAYDLFDKVKKMSESDVVGILIIYESEHLNKVVNYYHSEKYRNQFFVGWTSQNQQIRITYFNDVKLF